MTTVLNVELWMHPNEKKNLPYLVQVHTFEHSTDSNLTSCISLSHTYWQVVAKSEHDKIPKRFNLPNCKRKHENAARSAAIIFTGNRRWTEYSIGIFWCVKMKIYSSTSLMMTKLSIFFTVEEGPQMNNAPYKPLVMQQQQINNETNASTVPNNLANSPTNIIITTQVINPNLCPACRVGTLEYDYTCLGICCAIVFFPIGILCCLAMRNRRCLQCSSEF